MNVWRWGKPKTLNRVGISNPIFIMSVTIQTGSIKDFTTCRADQAWFTVKFPNPYPKDVIPKVFAQIQTYNGNNTPGLRITNVTNASFQIRMNEIMGHNTTSDKVGDLGLVKSDGYHVSEVLAWMAID